MMHFAVQCGRLSIKHSTSCTVATNEFYKSHFGPCLQFFCVCVCAHARVRVCACVCACVRACVRACVL